MKANGRWGRLMAFPLFLLFLFLLLFLSYCSESPLFERITVEEHDARLFPTSHGAEENTPMDCNKCHGGLDSFELFDCLGCHAHEAPETDPKHAAVEGYRYDSTACLGCHPMGQTMSLEEHEALFPVTSGSHAGIDCEACHADGDGSAGFTCQGCHSGTHTCARMATPHAAVEGYVCRDADCLLCHARGEVLSRDEHAPFFPIASGAHAPFGCSDCHTGNGASFTCIGCHSGEHSCARMDREHDEVRNYRCKDAECLSCHPSGGEEEEEEEDD